jgi:plastocyanin
VAVPKFFVAAPLLLAGIFAPALVSAPELPDRPNVVGMRQADFDRTSITLHAGDELEVVNTSLFLHTVAPGSGALVKYQDGMPRIGADSRQIVVMPRGRDYQTYKWNTPGTYHLTCTLHTDMTMTVVVLPAGA